MCSIGRLGRVPPASQTSPRDGQDQKVLEGLPDAFVFPSCPQSSRLYGDRVETVPTMSRVFRHTEPVGGRPQGPATPGQAAFSYNCLTTGPTSAADSTLAEAARSSCPVLSRSSQTRC